MKPARRTTREDRLVRQSGLRARLVSVASAAALLTLTVFFAAPSPATAGPGEPDPTFGAGGYVTVSDAPRALAYDPTTSSFLVGSDGLAGGEVRRYSTAGVLDAGFGAAGVATLPFLGVRLLAVDGSGRIIVVTHLNVARLLSSGAPDLAFGSGGVLSLLPFATLGIASSIAPQSDGGLLVLLTQYFSNAGVVRVAPDGTLDMGFGSGGQVTFPSWQWPGAIASRADDTFVVAGAGYSDVFFTSEDVFLAGFLADGSADLGFGTGGTGRLALTPQPLARPAVGVDMKPLHLKELGDGRFLMAGFVSTSTDPSIGIGSGFFYHARFLADGNPDTSYGSDGVALSDGGALGLAVEPDGAIVDAGGLYVSTFLEAPRLLRLRPDGAQDPGFGSCGYAIPDFGIAYSLRTVGAVLEPGGNVVLIAESVAASGGILAKVIGGTNDVSAEPDGDGDGMPDACDLCPDDADPAQPNADGDVYGDVCDPCTALDERRPTKGLFKITKKGAPAGDERLLLSGTIAIPASPALDPVSTGVRVVLGEEEQDTSVRGGYQPTIAADILVPAGAYDALTKTGWKVNKTSTSFKYKGASGITGVGITLKTGKDGVLRAKVKVIGKDLALPESFPVNGPGLEFAWLQLRGSEPSQQCGSWNRIGCAQDDAKMTLTCKWPF